MVGDESIRTSGIYLRGWGWGVHCWEAQAYWEACVNIVTMPTCTCTMGDPLPCSVPPWESNRPIGINLHVHCTCIHSIRVLVT